MFVILGFPWVNSSLSVVAQGLLLEGKWAPPARQLSPDLYGSSGAVLQPCWPWFGCVFRWENGVHVGNICTHTHIYRNIWKYMEIYGNILKYGNTGWISNVTMVMIYWKNLWLNSDWTTSRISTCTFWLNFFHGCICLYVFIYMLRSTKDRIVWLWCCAMGSLHMLLLP